MKRAYLLIIAGIVVTMLLSASDGLAQRKKFLSDNLRSDIDKELNLAKEKLSELDPIIQEKSDELLSFIDTEVEKGFLTLDSLSKEAEQKVDELRKELDVVLSDKNIQELTNFLNNLDENMIETIRQEIVNKAAKRLDLDPEQLKKAAPLLISGLDSQRKLLGKFLEQGLGAFDEFVVENDKLLEEMNSGLAKILTPKQMEDLELWETEVSGKIGKLFRAMK